MKSGKFRIIASVCCLVAAIALAAFTVFAWFTTINTAKTNGITTETTSGDVAKFEVAAYKATSTDGKTYTKGERLEDARMEDYTPRSTGDTGSTTAVILEITFKFNYSDDNKTIPLNATLNHDDVYKTDSFGNFIGQNYLSNAVTLKSLSGEHDSTEYTVGSKNYSFVTEAFVGDDNDIGRIVKTKKIDDITYNTADDYAYILMDYNADYINALYAIMLNKWPKEASLSTRIEFAPDIIFVLG